MAEVLYRDMYNSTRHYSMLNLTEALQAPANASCLTQLCIFYIELKISTKILPILSNYQDPF